MLSTTGNIRKNNKNETMIKLTRSYLAFTDSDGRNRPLLNNEEGHQILKNISFARGGQISVGGFTTTLTYKGVDVRDVNTTRGLTTNTNQNTPEGKEFDELIKKLLNKTDQIIEETSRETNIPKKPIKDIINETPSTPPEMTQEQINAMVAEKNKNHVPPKPGSSIDSLRRDIGHLPRFDGVNGEYVVLPDVPDYINEK